MTFISLDFKQMILILSKLVYCNPNQSSSKKM